MCVCLERCQRASGRAEQRVSRPLQPTATAEPPRSRRGRGRACADPTVARTLGERCVSIGESGVRAHHAQQALGLKATQKEFALMCRREHMSLNISSQSLTVLVIGLAFTP